MTKSEARQLAAGYAWGTEDTILAETGELRRTAVPHGQLSGTGSFLFATAFADQQDNYNKGNAGMMPSVGHAYANWQRSGGLSVLYMPVVPAVADWPAKCTAALLEMALDENDNGNGPVPAAVLPCGSEESGS